MVLSGKSQLKMDDLGGTPILGKLQLGFMGNYGEWGIMGLVKQLLTGEPRFVDRLLTQG